jgi:hypothetical protein
MILIDFRLGAPNYGKTTYPDNPKAQAFWIKEPIPVM